MRTKISPRVAHAIEQRYPLHWLFDGNVYRLMHGEEQLAVRWTDVSVLLLQNNLLNRDANIDPAAVALAVVQYYATLED